MKISSLGEMVFFEARPRAGSCNRFDGASQPQPSCKATMGGLMDVSMPESYSGFALKQRIAANLGLDDRSLDLRNRRPIGSMAKVMWWAGRP
jgi:hypothetical protein